MASLAMRANWRAATTKGKSLDAGETSCAFTRSVFRASEITVAAATVEQIAAEMNQVAEGVKTCGVVMELADRYEIEMPIAREVYGAIHGGRSALQAYRGLIRTRPGSEDEPG